MSPPLHAATVVPLRDRAAGGFELFMVKRHDKSGFMASAHVYPGGKLDEADCAATTAACCEGVSAEQAAALMAPLGERLSDDAPLSPERALGLFVAAVREVFEESGLLLAREAGPGGAALSFEDPEVAARFSTWRQQLWSGALSMTELAEREGLVYTLGELRYFAHWITPEVEPRRFNTRFFFARAPAGQIPLHDDRETVASGWFSPAEALDRHDKGEIFLAPPTLRTLEDMRPFSSVEAVMAAAPERCVAIMPRFAELDGRLTLLLPGDPLYPHPIGVQGPTRVELAQERWWSRHAG